MDETGAEKAPAVPARAKQGAEARDWSWVEASVWTDRMVSALENGVKGGRWYSLMDKVYAPDTLEAAGEKGPMTARQAWMGKASNGLQRRMNFT
jgi:RNA-directed DNA polymerase